MINEVISSQANLYATKKPSLSILDNHCVSALASERVVSEYSDVHNEPSEGYFFQKKLIF